MKTMTSGQAESHHIVLWWLRVLRRLRLDLEVGLIWFGGLLHV